MAKYHAQFDGRDDVWFDADNDAQATAIVGEALGHFREREGVPKAEARFRSFHEDGRAKPVVRVRSKAVR